MNSNDFIFYPLFIIIIVSVFTQLYYNDNVIFGSDKNQSQTLVGNQTLNEEESKFELEQGSLSLSFDMTMGLVAIIVSAIALGLIGLNILGSGLRDSSVKIIWNGIVFYGLWTIFSVLSYSSIASIPNFGVLFWFMITFIYSLGVFSKMGSAK